MDHGGEWRRKSGLKKYFCDLTLDPNTVHRKLSLSEENRKVTWSKEEQPYPDHPERFDFWEHVLCREGLTGRCYWEVEWNGRSDKSGVKIGVIINKYKGINRSEIVSMLGYNDKSWTLNCYEDKPLTLSGLASPASVLLQCSSDTKHTFKTSLGPVSPPRGSPQSRSVSGQLVWHSVLPRGSPLTRWYTHSKPHSLSPSISLVSY
ncbi:hypothetical protein UPYG_G00243890 [Umbra pygmaea]|uniref:B30.2/SPRY domain-containing protein n=1 Tax=Umbra pygmaea TaxID=75934 RepID=A0ABD0X6E8_UMBPY